MTVALPRSQTLFGNASLVPARLRLALTFDLPISAGGTSASVRLLLRRNRLSFHAKIGDGDKLP